jgi:alanine dehydrogenase
MRTGPAAFQFAPSARSNAKGSAQVIVGVPSEIKNNEFRVGMTPAGAHEFIAHGHTFLVQKGAGEGSSFTDAEYLAAGVQIVDTADEIFARSDMIIKVKEPQPVEIEKLRPGQILYTYLHLAAAYAKDLAKGMLKADIRAIAFETVELPNGAHPLLFPMSEVAGKMAIQAGATHLQKNNGGRGVLIGGVTGVPKAKVVIIGGGTVGINAAKVAVGMGARTVIMDKYAPRLTYLDDVFGGAVETVLSTEAAIEEEIADADIVVGGVLLPGGAQAPHLIKKSQLKHMMPGSVLVDVAIDQGGCFETSKPTSHTEPTYVVDGVIHYCVANIPGAVARTSTMALAGATLPYGLDIANKGFEKAVKEDAALALGVNVYRGKLTIPSVAEAHKMKYTPLDKVLA